MVLAKSPGDDTYDNARRFLDEDKIRSALQNASDFGASYAEVRLVSVTDSSVATRD